MTSVSNCYWRQVGESASDSIGYHYVDSKLIPPLRIRRTTDCFN
jgi:hypothetical protein